MTEYVGVEDVLADIGKHQDLGPVRDIGLLESALHRPQASAFGVDAYPTLAQKAAAMMHSIAQNQALVDGNKRLALLAGVTFLALNGARSTATDDQLFTLIIDMSAGLGEIDQIAQRLHVVTR